MDPKILVIIEEGLRQDKPLKQIEFVLGKAGFYNELQDLRRIFRSSEIKVKTPEK
jgi:hypothetical protein